MQKENNRKRKKGRSEECIPRKIEGKQERKNREEEEKKRKRSEEKS